MKKGFLAIIGVLAISTVAMAWNGEPYMEREILTPEQRAEALAELESQRGPRIERINSIDDEVVVSQLRKQETFLHLKRREDLFFDEESFNLSYTREQFRHVGDYQNLDEFLHTYIANFVAWHFVPEAQHFWITPPFFFPFEQEVRYTDVVMDDGEVKPLPDITRGQIETSEIRYDRQRFYFREQRSADDPKPVKLLAEIRATLPEELLQFEFSAADVGKTIKQGGYAVTLRNFTEFTYDVEIQVPDDQTLPLLDWDIIGEAISPSERHVSLLSEKFLHSDYYAQRVAWLDDITERALQGEVEHMDVRRERAALEERLAVVEGTTLQKAFSFLGAIDTARVNILPRAQGGPSTHQFEIPFYPRPRGDSDISVVSDTVLEGPIYEQLTQERNDLTAQEMPRLIGISYQTNAPDHPHFNYTEKVHLNYPGVHSQLFINAFQRYRVDAQAAAETVQFYDANGQLIALPDRDDLYTFTTDSFDYNPQYFPAWPMRATATLPVLTAPNIVKQNYALDNLPEGIRLQGNRLTVDYNVFVPQEKLDRRGLNVPNFNYFFAKDETQAYLLQAGRLIEITQEDRQPIHVFYFFGRPQSIEIWYQGETEVVNYEMDVELRDPPEDFVPAEEEPKILSLKEQFEQRSKLGERRLNRLKELLDEALSRLLWAEEQDNQRAMLASIASYIEVEAIRYTQPKLLHLADYGGDTAAMTDAYLQSLLAFSTHEHVNCQAYAGGQGLDLKQGFEFPFRHRLSYSHAVLDNGDVVQLPDVGSQERETEDLVQSADSYCLKTPMSENGPQLASVVGNFQAELPSQLLEFEFSAADVGKTIEKNGYEVTLLEFGQGRYAIKVDAVEGKDIDFTHEDILAEAVDEHGRYVDWWTTQHEAPEQSQAVNQLLTDLIKRAERGDLDEATAREELKELRDTFAQEQGPSLYLARAFNGHVDKALITLLPYAEDSKIVSQALELPVHTMPRSRVADTANLGRLPRVPATAPVYDGRSELRTSVMDLSPQQVQEQVTIIQRLDGLTGPDPQAKYPNQIYLYYPPVQSDLLLERLARTGSFVMAKLEFYDANDNRVRDLEFRNLYAKEFAYDLGLRGIDSAFPVARLMYNPERFTGKPERFKGTIPILTAPGLLKDSYTKDELPEGITLHGNQLIIDYAAFEPRTVTEFQDENVDRRNQVFMKDRNGYLAEIKQETFFHDGADGTDGAAVDVYYFYGEPETVEIWYLGTTRYVDYSMDIELQNPRR